MVDWYDMCYYDLSPYIFITKWQCIKTNIYKSHKLTWTYASFLANTLHHTSLSEQSSFICSGKAPSGWSGGACSHLPMITAWEQPYNNGRRGMAKSRGEPSNDRTHNNYWGTKSPKSAVWRIETQRFGKPSGCEASNVKLKPTSTLPIRSAPCGVMLCFNQSHVYRYTLHKSIQHIKYIIYRYILYIYVEKVQALGGMMSFFHDLKKPKIWKAWMNLNKMYPHVFCIAVASVLANLHNMLMLVLKVAHRAHWTEENNRSNWKYTRDECRTRQSRN